MNAILVLALSVGLVSADIGLTLRNYKVPETSYGVPSYQYSNNDYYNSGNSGSGYNYNGDSSAQAGYQGGFQAASSLGADSNYAGNYEANGDTTQLYNTGDLNSINTIAPSYYQYSGSQKAQDSYQNQYQYQSSSQSQASAVNKYQEFYKQWQQQPAQVFKHFYVHAAPEDPEPPKFRQPVALPPPQKHYKIIFIKAPSQTVYQPQYVPVPQANEEKTLVYVLVKKPEEQQEIQVPQIEQKMPAKPEVFFIKYNNKALINNIVNEHGKGDSASYVNGASGQYQGASGQYQGASGQYQGASGQYQGDAGQHLEASRQYAHGASGKYQGASGQYAQGASGQYQGASGQYVQSTSGQYQGASGQSAQGSSGQYNVGSGYNQLAQGGQASTAGHGLQSTADTSTSTGYSSASSAAVDSASSNSNYNLGNLNTISTSQGVPHETYGPPKFRV